jgi:anthranilate/para-aminobenzoate synthase component I
MATRPATRSDPLAAAARLAGLRGRVLLHSGRDDDGLGRWSFVAAEPVATLLARGRSLVELDARGRPARRFTSDPFVAAEAFLAAHGCALEAQAAGPPLPRVIGYLGYDLARVVERLPGGSAVGADVPDLWLAAYSAVARWQADGDVEIVGPDGAARARLAEQLARPAPPALAPRVGPLVPDERRSATSSPPAMCIKSTSRAAWLPASSRPATRSRCTPRSRRSRHHPMAR